MSNLSQIISSLQKIEKAKEEAEKDFLNMDNGVYETKEIVDRMREHQPYTDKVFAVYMDNTTHISDSPEHFIDYIKKFHNVSRVYIDCDRGIYTGGPPYERKMVYCICFSNIFLVQHYQCSHEGLYNYLLERGGGI